jgi:hypothetical protein
MNETRPTLTFHVTVPAKASREAVYDLLSDLNTHLVWAGEDAPRADFRLLSIDAPTRPAVVDDRFSSSGANNNGTFHDRSVVVEADPGERFGFDTEATLERKHGATWHARFRHRYAIVDADDGVAIIYVGEVRPQNYVPYWLKPGMRTMTRAVVQRMTRRNMENLARMASAVPRPHPRPLAIAGAGRARSRGGGAFRGWRDGRGARRWR